MSKTNAAGRKGPKVKVIILLIVLAIVIGFVAMMIYSASMMSGMTMAEVTELQKKNIENTISVSGIVESRTFEKVSANLQYNVETVNVEVGDKVKKGQVLAIVEAMKLMNEIESDFEGTIEEVLVENGAAVEYGQPLFVIK